MTSYDVETDLYGGPLSLLVELAQLNLIDLVWVKLMALTHQYLEEVRCSQKSLDELAEPLPLFGRLVTMKARALLPQPPPLDEDDEPHLSLQELERRLKEYEQFKSVAQLLAELHVLQRQVFTKPPEDLSAASESSPEQSAPFGEVAVNDLMSAFAKVLQKATPPVYEVKVEPWTVEMKVNELRVLLTVKRQVKFFELFTPEKDKLELVVTFLALLELIRQRVARAVQEHPFTEILIMGMLLP